MQQSRSRKTRRKSSTWHKHGRRVLHGINSMFNRWRRRIRRPLDLIDTSRSDWSSRVR